MTSQNIIVLVELRTKDFKKQNFHHYYKLKPLRTINNFLYSLKGNISKQIAKQFGD